MKKEPTKKDKKPGKRLGKRKTRGCPPIIIIAVIIAAGILGAGYAKVRADYKRISLDESVTFKIESGTGARKIADMLKENGIIKYPRAFLYYAKKEGYVNRFKAGSITINPGLSYTEIFDILIQDNRNLTKVTIPEGFEVRMIADRLEEAGVIDREKFMSLLKDASRYDYKFLRGRKDRDDSLEGYLFPDTYYIYPEDTEEDIIRMMLDEFDSRFPPEYYEKAEKLNMSVDDIVTLASIIERETDVPEERKKVAGVFYNRLKKNMKLQSCATVQYILKERKPNLSVEDTKINSPYNTYVNSGLPAGPIACPGTECMEAALNPENTDALYFVQGPDGKHIFSKTYEDHLKAKGDR
ncbi:MAG: endolytic transglycosylase MltG [Oscillospiraceae bacterium]|nr:endolytic transglycosylase MltG [Oscillospiraceae bacterium]